MKGRTCNRWVSPALLLLLWLSGCGVPASRATPPAKPAPTATMVPTGQAPAAAEDGWKVHTSTRWAISFAVPAAWQQTGEDRFEGQDGFARLEPFTGPGVSVDQACEWEANYHRERYGPAPAVSPLSRDNRIDPRHQPCLIHSADAQSAIVLPDPNPVRDEPSFLLLSVDRDHFQGVVRSLDYRLEAEPTPTLSGSLFGRTLPPDQRPHSLPLETHTFGDLTLEEYTIIDARVDGPGYFEFSQRIPPAVMEKRRAWRTPPTRGSLDPVQSDGQTISVEYADSGGVSLAGGMLFSIPISVRRDGQEIYRYHLSSGHAGTFPLFYLGNWGGRWVLEVNGMLIVDGQIVNQEWGYDEIFGCQELNGRPFYFFVQDGQTCLSYGGETLPVSYDYVYHGMCCEPAAFNVGGNDRMVWFYALRDGLWHYVELGAFDFSTRR